MWALLVFAATAATACGGARQNHKPPFALPTQFSQTGTTALPDAWWQSFADPALNQLVQKALDENFNLKIAQDRLAQAEATVSAMGAGLYPSLDARANANQRYWGGGASQTIIGGAGANNRGIFSLDLSASYEIDIWGRLRSSKRAAVLESEAVHAQVFATAITISAAVANTWFRYQESTAAHDVLHKQHAINTQVLKLVEMRFQKGLVTASDVFRQRQLVEAVQGEMTRAAQNMATNAHALATLTGQPPKNAELPKSGPLNQLPTLPQTGVPAELIQRRPDVQAALLRVYSADERVAAAIADRFPRLQIGGTAGFSATTLSELFSSWLVTLVGGLTAPLFDGGRRQAEVDRQKAMTEEAVHNYAQTVLTALQEVEDALVLEQKQREFLQSITAQLQLARASVRVAQQSYVNGRSDYLPVLDALRSQQALERTELSSKRELLEVRVGLCRALAGPWELSKGARS